MTDPDGPRILPLARDEWSDEARAAVAALLPAGVEQMKREKGEPRALNALGTLVRYPMLGRAFNTFNGHIIYTSSLTPRQRELLILRVAALRDAQYEWVQHTVLAPKVGIDEDAVARIAEGPDALGWSPIDAAMVRAVDELIADAMITDATWSTLSGELDEQQLMDLVFTVGAYDLLAMAFKSFRIELDDDLEPYVK
jgi:alkylhydroperoxidase family enzyme